MAALVDTNVLVYAVDGRDPGKRARAGTLLRDGAAAGSLKLPHQAVVEFVSVVSRAGRTGRALLEPDGARRAAEELLDLFDVLYPTEAVVRLALRGAAAYQLAWYDAHLWAYAEHHGCAVLYSEDFQHDRVYGGVRVVNPFAGLPPETTHG